MTTCFAEDLTAPEFFRFVNAETVGILPLAAGGLGALIIDVAGVELSRLGAVP